MASGSCPSCGAAVGADARSCPSCGSPLTPRPGPGVPAPPENGGGTVSAASADRPLSSDLNRRLARLAQWASASETLDVQLPRLPTWAEEAASRSRSPESWAEVVRAVERLAQRRLGEAFDKWEARTSGRIGRLEAYSVDSRLERGQVEDAVHAARLGDIAQALATSQQVDRVVALKERHLDQARGDLERLSVFLRDLEALGLVEAGETAEVATELERELRTGRLASLKQRLRLLRSRAASRVAEALPELTGRIGDRLAAERQAGAANDAEVRELATAAREVLAGRVEEGVHRLRTLQSARGLGAPDGPAKGSTERLRGP